MQFLIGSGYGDYNASGWHLHTGTGDRHRGDIALGALIKGFVGRPAVIAFVCGILCAAAFPPAAQAKAHCFCKLQSLSTTIANFGQIGTYGTQSGHDVDCRSLCDSRSGSYMNSSRASACSASHGGTIAAFYAVGTRAYQSGNNYTCPQTGGSAAQGSIGFDMYSVSRSVSINSRQIDLSKPLQVVTLQPQEAFANFELWDNLAYHNQAWTYSAKLYRDNVLVQELTKKSPPLSVGNVRVLFTGQPAQAVHGQVWKVEWYNFAPNSSNGSIEFKIP
jgi:hypothetical protein